MFKFYPPNKTGKDYIVSDIHGCFSDLEKQLEEINFNRSFDRLFSVGDLTDRGPESERSLGFLSYPWFFPVRGNHEDMVETVLDNPSLNNRMWHHQNGGAWLDHTSKEFKNAYIESIQDLPLVIQVGEIGIVHSRVPSGVTWQSLIADPGKYKQDLLWLRTEHEWNVPGIKYIIAGHTIHESISRYGNLIDIDTGSFLPHWGKPGGLTIVEMVQ